MLCTCKILSSLVLLCLIILGQSMCDSCDVVNSSSCILTRERFVVGHLIIILACSSIFLISSLVAPVYLLHHLAADVVGAPPAELHQVGLCQDRPDGETRKLSTRTFCRI